MWGVCGFDGMESEIWENKGREWEGWGGEGGDGDGKGDSRLGSISI